jgi:hypothetical protein
MGIMDRIWPLSMLMSLSMSTRDRLLGLLSGLVIGALGLYGLFYVISKGRLHSIFSEIKYKCELVKMMGSNPNLVGIYPSHYDAGANMHMCHQPKQYMYGDLQCVLDNGKYACVPLGLTKS